MAAATTGCSFVAPGLVGPSNGATPTFSYRHTSHSDDYLGVQMTFMTGTQTCYATLRFCVLHQSPIFPMDL
ncbi:hypothetical protein HBI49_230590 [Parastagonospora nodorum]|nr:hypothetical protein HBI49_230590 [Parastagonospora nodorum]